MDSLVDGVIVESAIENALETQGDDIPISVNEKFEELIKTETYDDNIIEIKSVGNLTTSSSYVIQECKKVDNKKLKGVKNRQLAAVKSVVERPKTARDMTKSNLKAPLKPHSPGQLPKYLQKRKDAVSKLSSITEGERPCSVTSSIKTEGDIKIHSKNDGKGDTAKSVASVVANEHGNEIDKLNSQIAQQKSKIMNLQTQIMDLKNNNTSLEKQLDEIKSARDKSENELKSSLDKIKNLEKKVLHSHTEQKRNDARKIELFEVNIANLMKDKQDLSIQIKAMAEDNQKLENLLEKMRNDLQAKSQSCETLRSEKNHLQEILEHGQSEEGKESDVVALIEKLRMLSNENEKLTNELNEKNNNNSILKDDKNNLINELKHLKSQMSKIPTDSTISKNELEGLHQQIQDLKKNENELKQRILTLVSKLDDEKNTNNRNDALLEFRAEYIKTLQDVDNVNKTRLVLLAKELEDARKHYKSFERFKAAHKEEKGNFEKMLKDLTMENTRLKATVETYEKTCGKIKSK